MNIDAEEYLRNEFENIYGDKYQLQRDADNAYINTNARVAWDAYKMCAAQMFRKIENMQEMVGDCNAVAIVGEYGGIEYFEPLEEGTYLFMHHWTKRDIEEAEQRAKEMYKLLQDVRDLPSKE